MLAPLLAEGPVGSPGVSRGARWPRGYCGVPWVLPLLLVVGPMGRLLTPWVAMGPTDPWSHRVSGGPIGCPQALCIPGGHPAPHRHPLVPRPTPVPPSLWGHGYLGATSAPIGVRGGWQQAGGILWVLSGDAKSPGEQKLI